MIKILVTELPMYGFYCPFYDDSCESDYTCLLGGGGARDCVKDHGCDAVCPYLTTWGEEL